MVSSGAVDVPALVARAARGDTGAAGAVFDATIDDAWRIAVTTVACRQRAVEAVSAAYARIWTDAADVRPGERTADAIGGLAPLSREWVLAWVYRVSREWAGAPG